MHGSKVRDLKGAAPAASAAPSAHASEEGPGLAGRERGKDGVVDQKGQLEKGAPVLKSVSGALRVSAPSVEGREAG